MWHWLSHWVPGNRVTDKTIKKIMVTLVILEQNMPETAADNNLQNVVTIKTSELQGKNMKRTTTFMCASGSLLPLFRQELASWQWKMEGNRVEMGPCSQLLQYLHYQEIRLLVLFPKTSIKTFFFKTNFLLKYSWFKMYSLQIYSKVTQLHIYSFSDSFPL